jgi:hypothetical protein
MLILPVPNRAKLEFEQGQAHPIGCGPRRTYQRVKVYVACRALFLSCLDRTPTQKLIFGKSDDPLH